MTVYCDCSNCQYNEDGCYCGADRIVMNSNGVCMTCTLLPEQDEEDDETEETA